MSPALQEALALAIVVLAFALVLIRLVVRRARLRRGAAPACPGCGTCDSPAAAPPPGSARGAEDVRGDGIRRLEPASPI